MNGLVDDDRYLTLRHPRRRRRFSPPKQSTRSHCIGSPLIQLQAPRSAAAGWMASPPPFDICDDLDDDDDIPTDPRHNPAAPPTPKGRNDRLLRLTRTRPQNPNPPPPPEAPAEEARKVKLAGRRRLCKLSNSSATAAAAQEEVEDDDFDDGRSIRNILDDLTTRFDSLSVHKSNLARPTAQHLAPLPCALAAESDEASTVISCRGGKAKPAEAEPFTTHHAHQEVHHKGATRNRGGSRVPKASASFLDYDVDDSDYGNSEEQATSTFRNYDDDDDLGEKENHAVAVNISEDEKTEDFKMEPTASAASNKPYTLQGRIFKSLFPYQRESLQWLWDLHCRGTGGILGDDMGLGKTREVSAFLAGLFHSRLVKRVLVVVPKSLLHHWTEELSVVDLKEKIRDYYGPSTNLRNYELQYAFKEGGILLTTYDIVRNNYKLIRGNSYNHYDDDDEETMWNYVILDEGHYIKNKTTQRAQRLFEIPCIHRIVISGTPIQNNLKEMWTLFNFCCPDVLGDKQHFKTRYDMAILRGTDKCATAREKHIGSNVAKEFRERIKPYFLRRMKSEGFLNSGASEEKNLAQKNELIVWLKLTACQRKLYEAFLKSELVHFALQPKGSPFAAITILKKICGHPLLLTKTAAEGVLEGMDEMLNDQDKGMVEKMAMNYALQVGEDISCKLTFIMSLLRNLIAEGHHVLIFSQSCEMLNFIQEAILLEGYKFLRIDGTTEISERERIVKDFQEGPGAPIFLLSTRVGGLGLTLTKAARVIVVDPAWNPSTDNQSVDRAYRIGQTKDVIVYRLMTCATIEEKIYKLQVVKAALFRTATEQKEQTRYFSKSELRELFSLPKQGFDVSLTHKQLQEEHGQQVIMDESLRKHIQFLEQQGIAGVSHHSLLFSKTEILPALTENFG